jgi:hypothetical protein
LQYNVVSEQENPRRVFVFVFIPNQNCVYKTSFIRYILQCIPVTIWGRGGRGDDVQTNKTKVGLESCNLGIVFNKNSFKVWFKN